MNEFDDVVGSDIDTQAPIDFEKLRLAVETNGPIRLSMPSMPYTVTINVQPCMCSSEGCEEMLVPIWRTHGVFTMHWLLSQEDLERFPSLDALLNAAIGADIIDSRGERLLIEAEVFTTFETRCAEAPRLTCFCSACAEAVGQDLSPRMLLSQLAHLLSKRDSLISSINEDGGVEECEFVSKIFDLGFAAGRIFSELDVKRSIEADALAGREAASIKKRREEAAGARSKRDRESRMAHLLEKMECLCEKNPALARLSPSQVASLAVDDAADENPALWRQGRGQVDEYLGQIRRGEAGDKLRERYLNIFPKKK